MVKADCLSVNMAHVLLQNRGKEFVDPKISTDREAVGYNKFTSSLLNTAAWNLVRKFVTHTAYLKPVTGNMDCTHFQNKLKINPAVSLI